MPEVLVPTATIQNENSSWTATGAATLHECVDEGVDTPNDGTDYALGPSQRSINYRMTLQLSNPSAGELDPNGTYKIRARGRRNSGLVSLDLRVQIWNAAGTVPLAALDMAGLQNAYVTQEYTLTPAEIAAFSGDFDNLLAIVYASGSGTFAGIRLTALQFEVPTPLPVLTLTRVGAESWGTLPLVSAEVTRAMGEVIANVPSPRVSRMALEAIGAFPGLRSTRMAGEVISGISTPFLSRFGVEAWAERSALASAAITRMMGEAIGPAGRPRVSRVMGEAIADFPDPRVTRFGLEVFAGRDDATAAYTRTMAEVIANVPAPRVTRHGMEVIASWSEPAITRMGLETWAAASTPTAAVSRLIGEVIGTRGAPRVSRVLAEAIADRVTTDPAYITRLAAEAWASVNQENVVHRIDCGAADDYIDGEGNTWDADRDFTGGLTFSTADPITNTDDPELYQTERYGSFFYTLPVANGSYTVRLHFAENFFQGAGERVFSININGTQVETDLDIFAEVGHDVAMVRSYGAVSAIGGTGITITLTPSVDNAKLSAIEVISSAPASDTSYISRFGAEAWGTTLAMENDLRLTRLGMEVYAEAQYPTLLTRAGLEVIGTRGAPRVSRVIAEAIANVITLDQVYLTRMGSEVWAARDTPTTIAHHRIRSGVLGAYTDSLGNEWDADRDYVGAVDVFSTPDAITGTDDGPLYQDERFGVGGALWGYVLEVPGPGTYRVRIHLAEIYHEAVGLRLFDIEINGETVEADIDIFAEVGHDVALIKEYEVEVGAATASTITVYFRSTIDSGKCAAIEVLEDTIVDRVDLTRMGLEVFGQSAELEVTRVGSEVIADVLMDHVLATRFGVEVYAPADQGHVHLSRVVGEVISSDVRFAHLTRLMGEVIATGKPPLHVSRLAAEVFGFLETDVARITRVGAEVFGKNPHPIQITRYGIECFARWIQGNAPILATRVGAEVFARAFGTTGFQPLDLVASDLFIANWRDEVVVDTAWNTDITDAGDSVSEDRVSLVDRPYRTEEVTLTGLNIDQANRLVTLAQRHGQGRLTVPLYSDFSRVTAPSGGTLIFCATSYRRFFPGGRILIHGWTNEARRRPGGAEYAIIQQVTASGLVLTEPLAKVFDVGARVYAVMDTELQLTSEVSLITDEVAELGLRISEVVGESALPPTIEPGTFPPGFPIYQDDPVLAARPDWLSRVFVRADRPGDLRELGRAILTRARGERPRMEYSVQHRGLDRANSYSLIQFFDSRAGRTHPFWWIDPGSMWKLISSGTYHIDVEPITSGVAEQQALYGWVAIKMRSNVLFLRRVVEFRELAEDHWRIDVDAALPAIDPLNVHRITTGHHVRFVADLMRERWTSDEHCTVSIGLLDLLEEQDVDIEIPPPVTDYQSVGTIADLHLWVDASKGMFNGQAAGSRFNYPLVPNRYVTAWDDARHDPDPKTSSDPCLYGRHPQETQTPKSWEHSPSVNGGLRSAISLPSAPFNETKMYLMTGNTHIVHSPGDSLDLPYWNNALGLTVIWCGKLAGKKTDTSFIRSYGSHDWNYTALKLYTTKGVDNPPSWATYDDVSDYEDVQILVAQWVPAFSVRVWQHGNPIGQSIVSPGTLDPNVDGHGLTEPSSIVCCELGDGSWTNAFLIFKRALNMTEMNAIGRILSKRFAAPWTDVLN